MHCKTGWRIWSFVKIQTNDGLISWSRISESNGSPKGIEGVINDLSKFLINQNPLHINKFQLNYIQEQFKVQGSCSKSYCWN